jgi:hypothetical protein
MHTDIVGGAERNGRPSTATGEMTGFDRHWIADELHTAQRGRRSHDRLQGVKTDALLLLMTEEAPTSVRCRQSSWTTTSN